MQRAVVPGTEEGWQVIDAAVQSAQARLGDGLLSAYAIGSLAHGGFALGVSDVDLALLTDHHTGRQTSAAVAAITAEIREAGPALGDRLSVFHAPWEQFADPPPDARFPPIDRYDLVRYGILVQGDDLRGEYATAPSAEEIRAQAVDSALRRATPEQLSAELRGLADGGVSVHDATKMVLWPVRLQHVCDSGEATGNDAAVDHYLQMPAAGHVSLVSDALGWRDLRTIPDPETALRRIADEIHGLHAEVFARLSEQPGTPRADEITERALQLAATRPPAVRRSGP